MQSWRSRKTISTTLRRSHAVVTAFVSQDRWCSAGTTNGMVAGRIDDLVATVQQRSSLGGTASSLIRCRDFDIVVQCYGTKKIFHTMSLMKAKTVLMYMYNGLKTVNKPTCSENKRMVAEVMMVKDIPICLHNYLSTPKHSHWLKNPFSTHALHYYQVPATYFIENPPVVVKANQCNPSIDGCTTAGIGWKIFGRS